MKKTTLNTAIAIALSASAFAATSTVQAASLSIDQGNKFTTTYVSPRTGQTFVSNYTTGSWFSMDADGSNSVEPGEITPIGGLNGVNYDDGTIQAASGSHGGAPGCTFDAAACSVGFQPAVVDDPLTTAIDETAAEVPGVNFTEAPNIDNPWLFFSNTGMSYTSSPITTLSNDGVGGATLDFSGWGVTWAGIPAIPMGGDPVNFPNSPNDGIASMSCYTSSTPDANWPFDAILGAATACSDGAAYVLDYKATVPLGDASGFGGVPYVLHLEGTISAVPVPAAVWLFGSGLLGLVGVARRRKA